MLKNLGLHVIAKRFFIIYQTTAFIKVPVMLLWRWTKHQTVWSKVTVSTRFLCLKIKTFTCPFQQIMSWKTFVLVKTSFFVCGFRRRVQDILINTNKYVLVIRLHNVFKTSSRRFEDVFQKHLQNVFKTSCKGVFQDVFNTSWRCKYEVKLFLLTRH